jgi:hypothetical protein
MDMIPPSSASLVYLVSCVDDETYWASGISKLHRLDLVLYNGSVRLGETF